ncbi:MAG: SLC13 family permease [Bacillota bacterium]|nr:SLC13 family permease [Bacillota bacterium]HOA78430.1 SLC13 family permease [Bacilli bacterium]HPZ27537.1 SLC13 family permease [Bacilli bacterium]HQC89577.1 SLC13 family permease [Bacilli bacterium]
MPFAALFTNSMLLPVILFLVTYVLLLVIPKYRPYIALATALIFIGLKILPVKAAFKALDWNVLFMIIGTMGIVSLFIESKMPALLADKIIEKTPNVKWAVVSLALFAGVISAFVDNVSTVLMIAPVALDISKKLKISPVPSIIAIAIASNLQGAATLVGDTTSIMLGRAADMDFFDFFFFRGRPGIFWIVELGALASTLILFWFFRKENQPVEPGKMTEVKDYFPTILLCSMIGLLIIASFIPNKPYETNGYICLGVFLIGLMYKFAKTRSVKSLAGNFKEIDLYTILLLVGLFVIIAGLEEAGVIVKISEIIANISKGNLFLIYTIIVWVSVLFSAFVDNIPYVATMLPVVASIGATLGLSGSPKILVLYYGLLIGATLGGNLTPIGASANIAGIGILRKEGYEVKAGTFMKMGVPFTLAAVITGYVLTWLIWYVW